MAKSTYLADKILDAELGGVAFTYPTPIYAAAMTAAPTAAGGGTEVSGGGYARVSCPTTDFATAAASGSKSNTVAINFPQATANWGTVVDIAFYDAATSGNLLDFGTLSTSVAVNNGNTLTFPPGSLTFTES